MRGVIGPPDAGRDKEFSRASATGLFTCSVLVLALERAVVVPVWFILIYLMFNWNTHVPNSTYMYTEWIFKNRTHPCNQRWEEETEHSQLLRTPTPGPSSCRNESATVNLSSLLLMAGPRVLTENPTGVQRSWSRLFKRGSGMALHWVTSGTTYSCSPLVYPQGILGICLLVWPHQFPGHREVRLERHKDKLEPSWFPLLSSCGVITSWSLRVSDATFDRARSNFPRKVLKVSLVGAFGMFMFKKQVHRDAH